MKNFIISLAAILFLLVISPTETFAQYATLSLDPATGTYNRSCPFSLKVNLDTGGIQTDGTDAIIFYDTTRLTAVSITNGTIYPDYPGNNIDPQAGKITISGLASVSTPFTGTGTLATINFQVNSNAATGATQVTFDFDPNYKAKTTDSNVVERETIVDVLNSVVNGTYTIGTGACGTTTQPSPTPTYVTPVTQVTPVTPVYTPVYGGPVGTPSAQIPTKTYYLPPAGSEQFTYAVAIFGGILTALGILGLALL